MIDIFIRHTIDLEGQLFNQVNTIDEVNETIEFIKKTPIYMEGPCRYEGYSIDIGKKGIFIEIIIEDK